MTELERAIDHVKKARKSHVDAIAWLARQRRRDPAWARLIVAAEGGGVVFHRRCVREYDLVLRVLKRCRGHS